jgi:hypothetical protein
MRTAFEISGFVVEMIVGFVLARRWPEAMRQVSRGMSLACGLCVVGIVATGSAHHVEPLGDVHRWLPHALFIVAWNVVPIAAGVEFAQLSAPPLRVTIRALGRMFLIPVLWVDCLTGYVGPSHGPIDPMNLRRFEILHFWLGPLAAFALVIWWFRGARPVAPTSLKSRDQPAKTCSAEWDRLENP